jgi:nitrogen fixation/metabolism regulation signal transduction histidine kinase
MTFKNFRLNCTIRLIVLVASIGLLYYLITSSELYSTMIIVGLAIVMQVWALFNYIDQTNRDLARFLLAVQHSDFTSSFYDDGRGGSHRELRLAFEEVLRKFRSARLETQEHYRYLQTVVKHVGVGLIAFTPDGEIDLINTATKRQLGLTKASNLDDIRRLVPNLVDKLQHLSPGQRTLVKVRRDGELLQLSLAATVFRMAHRSIKLVSVQNIAGELAEKEMQAWQQLVRVLTHEIMNSVTPISSLAGTAREMIDQAEEDADEATEMEARQLNLNDLRAAVSTIEKRSDGLVHFVEAYRHLTRIPKPEFAIIAISDLFDVVVRLTESRSEARNIRVQSAVDPPSLELTADADLVEQVLLNLTTNSLQSLNGQADGTIKLHAHLGSRGRILVEVIDNGPGMGPDALESVFVPFYTTKSEGTGIGLSLARQIMRLHKGEISVTSVPGERTVFKLQF